MQIVPQQDSPLANRQERSEGAASTGATGGAEETHRDGENSFPRWDCEAGLFVREAGGLR